MMLPETLDGMLDVTLREMLAGMEANKASIYTLVNDEPGALMTLVIAVGVNHGKLADHAEACEFTEPGWETYKDATYVKGGRRCVSYPPTAPAVTPTCVRASAMTLGSTIGALSAVCQPITTRALLVRRTGRVMACESRFGGATWQLYGVGSWFSVHPHVVNRSSIYTRKGKLYRFGWPLTQAD